MKRVENPLAPEAVSDLCIIVVEDTQRDEVHCVPRAVLAVINVSIRKPKLGCSNRVCGIVVCALDPKSLYIYMIMTPKPNIYIYAHDPKTLK